MGSAAGTGAVTPRTRTSASSLAAIAVKLPFVQVELAGTVGLEDGRYLARTEGGPDRVLVVEVAGRPVPPRRRLTPRRPKRVEGDAGSTVPLTTITAIRSEPLGEAAAASEWLRRLSADAELIEAELKVALGLINRAVHAHRTAVLDPCVPDVSAEHALCVRVGFGTGAELADGRFAEAVELPPSARRRRAEVLRPQERLAAVLGGRETVATFELPLLRARADLDAGRAREGAQQLRIGLEGLLGEPDAVAAPDQADDLATLRERRAGIVAVCEAARLSELDGERAAELERTLRVCERVLRRARLHGS